MTSPRMCLLACLLLALWLDSAFAAEKYRTADATAQRIDRQIAAVWKQAKVEPAKDADDSEFVRRVYLDLAGRIPTVREARVFLADKRADRRMRLVEKLLEGPRFVRHFTTVWRSLLLPEANANFTLRFQVPPFERWLEAWLASRRGMDRMARDLLTQAIDSRQGSFFFNETSTSAAPFFAVREYQAEEIAGAVSRLFLGVNLACAQCHNHPFADWKREQFWAFTAFFSGIEGERRGDFFYPKLDQPDRHEIAIPNTEKKVKARFLDGKQPEIKEGTKTREVLADWLVSKDNPYFARAIVNRTWAQLFGTGLVEPLDEMARGEGKSSPSKLLDELATAFIENKYDLRWLLRSITATRAYQLSSLQTSPGQDDPKLFARMHLRGLTPEQLFDSLATATGFQEPARGAFAIGPSVRAEFLTKFGNAADRPTEVQTSILQALALMNGKLTADATSLEKSETLAALADVPFMTTAAKVEVLYLAALSRRPTAKETSKLSRYIDSGGVSTAKEKSVRQAEALADVFWALLNSGEFKFNH